MKKYTFLFVIFFFPGVVFAEEITQFNVDIKINEDATIDVVEEIYYDFGSLSRHGIYRDIPVKYKDGQGNNRSIKIDGVRVVDQNDVRYTYQISKEGKNKRIKIGDVDESFTGKRVYIISYTIDGAMNYLDTHDELYWNAIGGEWTVPINAAHVVTHAPQIDRVECYFGQYGSTQKCDNVIKDSQKTEISSIVSEFMQNDIVPGKYMTIVIGMPVGTIYKPTSLENIISFIRDNGILGSPIFVLLLMFSVWFMYGRDPEGNGTIVPYYEAPEGLSPAEIGMIAEDSLKKEHVSALIIDLAVRGYITITRKSKKMVFSSTDYVFTKTGKNISDLEMADEKMMYERLLSQNRSSTTVISKNGKITTATTSAIKFANGRNVSLTEELNDSVNMSSLKNSFHMDLQEIMQFVRDQVAGAGFYTKSPKKVRGLYTSIGFLIIFAAFFFNLSGSFLFALIVSGLIIIVFGFIMPKRTKKGSIMREKILGLKLYLETAEKDRINFHNAPEKDPKKFEELLPYAIALGVEEKWAKQFEGICDGNPQWYDGGGTAFTPAVLAHEMSSLSNAAVSTMSSKPSSAGSGSSGFSGGGGGGGFGGGGGGSW